MFLKYLVEIPVASSQVICIIDKGQVTKYVEQDLAGKRDQAGHF